MTARKFISLFGGVAAAWSLAAHAQESGTFGTTNATTATLPQIKVARVKPVESTPPNLRLSDDRIDLMSWSLQVLNRLTPEYDARTAVVARASVTPIVHPGKLSRTWLKTKTAVVL